MSCARSSTSSRATDTSAADPPADSHARIGILGGTFNPPHLGHLELARHARDELGLAEVWLVPARLAPHKAGARDQDPGPEHRLAMCRLAVAGEPRLSVSEIELEREGPSYTVDTLISIHDQHPDVQPTLILGADVAATLPSWQRPAELLELADLAVALRPGSDRRQVLDAVAAAGGGEPPAR